MKYSALKESSLHSRYLAGSSGCLPLLGMAPPCHLRSCNDIYHGAYLPHLVWGGVNVRMHRKHVLGLSEWSQPRAVLVFYRHVFYL